MTISQDLWVDAAKRQEINGGQVMPIRRVLVIHHTSGATGQSSIDGWIANGGGVCAHFVIDRDATLVQVRPLNRTCGHVGGPGLSRWRDPNNADKLYDGLNSCSIGIELANAGSDPDALRWARKQPGFVSQQARHRNGGPIKEWEAYPQAQLDLCFALSQAIFARFKLDDITGHDCVSPERRDDPGPLFPMQELRQSVGLAGLPRVWAKTGSLYS